MCFIRLGFAVVLMAFCVYHRSLPFKKAQTIVDFASKRCVFGLEMVGFFLQHDLGIMKNVLLWF
jgi:hypothetical protein